MNEYIKDNLKLRDFQQDAVEFLLARSKGIIALPTGTGKTITAFTTYANIKQQHPNLKLLYVTEKPLIMQTISQDLPTYFNFTNTHIYNNTKQERIKKYKEWLTKTDILVINYSSLRIDFTLIGNGLQTYPAEFMVIFDEATNFRNTEAQITQCVTKLCKAVKYAYAMTATPASRGLYDIFSIMLTMGIAPYQSREVFEKLHATYSMKKMFFFRSGNYKAMGVGVPSADNTYQTCYMSLKKKFKLSGNATLLNKPSIGDFRILSDINASFSWSVYNEVYTKCTLIMLNQGKRIPVIASVFNDRKHIGYKNLKLFRERSQGTMFIRAKHEIVSELPPVTVTMRYCDIDKNSEEAVKFVYNSEKYSASQIEIAQATPQAFLEHIAQDYKTDKIQRIIEFIKDDIQGEKVIIYFPYTTTTTILKAILEQELEQEVCYCYGNNPNNNEELQRFLTSKDIQVLIGTNTILKGLNIQAVNHIITLQAPYTAENYIQLVGRINRIGGDYNPKFITHFVCDDTRDIDIYTALNAQLQHINKIDPKLIEQGLLPQDKTKEMTETEAKQYLDTKLNERKTLYL